MPSFCDGSIEGNRYAGRTLQSLAKSLVAAVFAALERQRPFWSHFRAAVGREGGDCVLCAEPAQHHTRPHTRPEGLVVGATNRSTRYG